MLKNMQKAVSIKRMKVIKTKRKGIEKVPVLLRLKKELIDEIDRLADKKDTSRQRVIEAIIEAALKSDSFVIEIEE